MTYSWAIPIVVLLISLYFYDRKNWRNKPLRHFHEMVRSDDYVGWNIGLTQLRKRGVDINPYLEPMVGRLADPERIVREAAKTTLTSNFPYLKPALKGLYCLNDLDNAIRLTDKIRSEHCGKQLPQEIAS